MTRTPSAAESTPRRSPKNHAPRLRETIFRTGHTFRDPTLLALALTHSSRLHEDPSLRGGSLASPAPDNEQLEFLGDAVLSLVVAEVLFRSFPFYGYGYL